MDKNIPLTSLMVEQETFWQAIQDRDPAFTGVFVYGVRSTGIYCKPGCTSRRPRRQQVVFFHTCDEAEAAGFRPCRRCQPRQALSLNAQTELVQRVCGLIDASLEEPPTLAALSQALHFSPSHLHRLFKAVTGLTPRQYAAGQRIRKLKSNLKTGDDVTTALYGAGFTSSSRLYESAAGRLGMTPAVYRKGGPGMKIHYTIVSTYLGRMLVAATLKGICAVSFGEQDAALESFLHSEYPAADLERDDRALKDWTAALVEHLQGARPALDLPLDLQATAFQLRVWEELRRIPYGQTRSYAEVALAIGQPHAIRAVGRACASNPAVIVTPCHRVVRSDGGLGGYRWGIERKQALLARERSERSESQSQAELEVESSS
jgi:AraC family transcriptional regulator of adaptative response/methylated-DNA-[protein]-cysteine methyltransferase